MQITVTQKNKIWTYDDYITLPDDLNIYEIIEGELYMAPAPIPKHQKICHNIQRLLGNYLQKNNAGEIYPSPVDVVFDKSNILQPDIIFIARDNLSIVTEKNIQGPPNLVIEILSPSTIRKDRISKLRVYARFEVKNVWIIDPDNQTLEAFELGKEKNYHLISSIAGEEEFRPSLFPDLIIPLKEIWK